MHEITGKELERALLKTQGRTWDGVPLPKLSVADLKQDALQLFKEKAVKSGRLKVEDVEIMYSTVSFAGLQVKASGGIRDKEAAIAMIKAGAARLGTSSGVKIVS